MLHKILLVGAALAMTYGGLCQLTDTTGTLDDVVVTATKFEQKLVQAGKAVTLISRRQIEAHPGHSLGQLLQDVAGIGLAGANNNMGSEQVLYMRGANVGRASILIDGVPVSDPSLINAEFDLNQIAPQQIERIEILRGAQSTLYGSSAIAGVINIITRKGNGKVLSGNALLSFGSRNTLRSQVQLLGAVNKWDYAASYGYDRTNGFSAAWDSTKSGDFENDGFYRHTAMARLGYKAGKFITLNGFTQFSSYRASIDAGAFQDERDHLLRNQGHLAGLQANFRKNKWKGRAAYRFQEVRRGYRNDSLHQPSFTLFMDDAYYGRNHYAEAYGSVALNENFELLLGVDYQKQAAHSGLLSISSFGPFESSFTPPPMDLLAGYATALMNFGRLSLEAGARMNRHSVYGPNLTYSLNPALRLGDYTKWFGSISTGFKAPSLYQLYSSSGREDLAPEKAFTAETGLHHHNGKVLLRQTIFYRNTKDGLDFDYNHFLYFNFLQQKGWGLESEWQWAISSAWNLRGNYTFLNFEETTQSREDFSPKTYTYLLRRPRHQGSASLTYQPREKWLIRLSGRWVGQRWDVGSYMGADQSLKAYSVYDVHLGYQASRRVKWFADMMNATNSVYHDVRGFSTMPRSVFAGIKVALD